MNCLLDTHVLFWVVLGSPRLAELAWLPRYAPWGLSPVSLLEVQFLAEVGKLEVDMPAFTTALLEDSRFVFDDVPLLKLVQQALPLSWTRDPFDRLLAAHSVARRSPLCTLDRNLLTNHVFIPSELRSKK